MKRQPQPDNTREGTLERALQQHREAMEHIVQVVNDLNNMLTVMRGRAQLANETGSEEAVRDLVDVVLAGTERARNVIRDALGEAEQAAETVREEKRQQAVEKARILIVDDEPAVRALLQQLLLREGHEVETAGSGSGALVACGAAPFDVVFLDLHLGDMDGLEVFRQMAEKNVARHVMFLSGDPNIEDAWQTVRERGADGFIKKPFDINEINNAVERLLAMPQA
jgi:CheY-like chemotaxis protein